MNPGPNQTEKQRKHAEYMRGWNAAHREASASRARSYYERNKERFAANGRAWRAKNKERASRVARNLHLLRKFALTPEAYEAMVIAQGGLCAICEKPPTAKYLDVDHDHQTGEVRALLCRQCNAMLGQVSDSPRLLLRAAEYLDNYRQRKAATQ